ncbi:MAG: polysaccharide deacetylase family protein [Burkholderiales bacterium]|nr:polysaccharide deacetylase family protein [Burkholderiales bacterium]
MTASALPVLMYHHVTEKPGLVTVHPRTFREQMAHLAGAGWKTAGCRDLEAFLAGAELPDKSVLLTFDDGYLDNYVYAHPVLLEFGLHAAIFLVTGWIGDGPARRHAGMGGDVPECPDHREAMAAIGAGRADRVMLRWSEVEAMRSAGSFEFHSHTHGHRRWDRDFADSAARRRALAEDLGRSRAALAARLASSAHLCWPYGYREAGYAEVAREAGFRFLYTVERGANTRDTPPEAIRRVVVKDRAGAWFASRLTLYGHERLARLYLALRGRR